MPGKLGEVISKVSRACQVCARPRLCSTPNTGLRKQLHSRPSSSPLHLQHVHVQQPVNVGSKLKTKGPDALESHPDSPAALDSLMAGSSHTFHYTVCLGRTVVCIPRYGLPPSTGQSEAVTSLVTNTVLGYSRKALHLTCFHSQGTRGFSCSRHKMAAQAVLVTFNTILASHISLGK